MNTALKYGLIAAAAGLGIYSIVKSNKEEENTEEKIKLALQQAAGNLKVVETYGTWRTITQPASMKMGYYVMDIPPAVEGKTLINLYVEADIDTWRYGAVVSLQDKHTSMILCTAGGDLKGAFRVVGQWI